MRSLHHEVINDFLGLGFVNELAARFALEVDVEEGRGAARRHGGAVLFLHRSQVGEVQPLDRFLRGPRGLGDVEAVRLCHFLELTECADLLRASSSRSRITSSTERSLSRAAFSAFLASIR